MSRQPLSLFSFFNIEAREYVNFTFDAATREMTRNVILGLCAVMLLVSLYALYQKYVPGAIVRAILRAQAHSKETAKTAEELGLDKNFLVLLELKFNLSLKKLLRLANEEDAPAEVKEEVPAESEPTDDADGTTEQAAPTEATESAEAEEDTKSDDAPAYELARFYIPEELKYRAENQFNKRENNPFTLLIATGLITAFGIALIKLLPIILTLFDNIIK